MAEHRDLNPQERLHLFLTVAQHKQWGCTCEPRIQWADELAEGTVTLTTGEAEVYISHHEKCPVARMLASTWN